MTMRKKLRLLKVILLLSVAFPAFKIFYPRTYNVPDVHQKEGIKYWHLSTGSLIGYTFISGKGNRKPYPIIYVNGGPGGHVTDTTISTLAQLANDGYDIYFYDQIGSGQSARLDNIADYTPERHVKDLEAIVKATGAQKAILIGHSWGAVLTVLFAADHADLIDRIVFSCPGPVYPLNKTLANEKAPDSLGLKDPAFTNAQGSEQAQNLRSSAMAFFATRFGKKIATDKEADAFETYLNLQANKSATINPSGILKPDAGAGFYARVMTYNSLLHVADPRPKVKGLKIPVLIMKAQFDNQKWGYTNEYCTLFPNHQLKVIPQSGHFILLDQPEISIKAMRDFLSR